jgi:DNA repair protein RadA
VGAILGGTFKLAKIANSDYESKRVLRITTGSQDLDELLFGGIETHAITEIYGMSGTGKTQFCHTLSVIVQEYWQKGGLNGKALFIDTENTFRPERILSIARARGLGSTNILRNIIYVRIRSSFHLESILKTVPSIIDKDSKVRLLLVDSIIGYYRSKFSSPKLLPQRQQRLSRVFRGLSDTAQRYGVAVVVTNQINFGSSFTAKPAGGSIMDKFSTYRISLRRIGGGVGNIQAKIIKSQYHPEGKSYFKLCEKGIDDINRV